MNKESAAISQSQIETRRLGVLLETSAIGSDFFILRQVKNSGYIIQNKNRAPLPNQDWLLFDYDDTLAAYTQIKQERASLLEAHFLQFGIELKKNQIQQIIDTTDKFSRWREKEGEGIIYHPNAHMMSLQWIVDSILHQYSCNEASKAIKELLKKLASFHSPRHQDEKSQSDMPFYLRSHDKKLVKKNGSKLWSRELENIFLRTVLDPPSSR